MQLGMGPLAVSISESIAALLSGPQEELKWFIAPLQTKIKWNELKDRKSTHQF